MYSVLDDDGRSKQAKAAFYLDFTEACEVEELWQTNL